MKTALLKFIVCGISHSLVESNAVCREKFRYAFGELKYDCHGSEFHETCTYLTFCKKRIYEIS
jgi:hypothetical protein